MIIRTDDDMRAFGERLAAQLKGGDWLAIDGTLGAGKTVLCAGILRGLGFTGEVTSPSYAIVHRYEPDEVTIAVAHADLYRLENVAELEELGLADDRDDRITLIEWAERANADLARPTHLIHIEILPDGSRNLTMKTGSNDATI